MVNEVGNIMERSFLVHLCNVLDGSSHGVHSCIYLLWGYEFIIHLHHLYQTKTLVKGQNPMSSVVEFQVVKLPFTQGKVTQPALGFSKRL